MAKFFIGKLIIAKIIILFLQRMTLKVELTPLLSVKIFDFLILIDISVL